MRHLFALAFALLVSACATTQQPDAPVYLYATPSEDLAVHDLDAGDRPLYEASGEGWYRVRLGGESLYMRAADVRRLGRDRQPARRARLSSLRIVDERPLLGVAREAPADRLLVTGPRGGCYYLSGSGGKVYVPRSLCAEQAVRLAAETGKGPAAAPPSAPSYGTTGGSSYGTGGPVRVRGYTRKDGTYVRPHTRSRPSSSGRSRSGRRGR